MSRLFYMPQAVRINSAGLPYAGAKINFYLTGTTTRTDTYQDNALGTAHANPVVADSAGQFAAIYLDPDITYKAVITDASDNVLDTVDPVHSPIAASAVTVTDTGGYFAGTDVEVILADIGANYAKLSADETIAGDWVVSGSVNFADKILKRAMLQDVGYLTQVIVSASNAATINVENGNSITHTLTENVTYTISNPTPSDDYCEIVIQIIQDGAGGAYTVTWPASVNWGGGSAPTISTGNDAVDIIVLRTWNGGTAWFGDYVQNYS